MRIVSERVVQAQTQWAVKRKLTIITSETKIHTKRLDFFICFDLGALFGLVGWFLVLVFSFLRWSHKACAGRHKSYYQSNPGLTENSWKSCADLSLVFSVFSGIHQQRHLCLSIPLVLKMWQDFPCVPHSIMHLRNLSRAE